MTEEIGYNMTIEEFTKRNPYVYHLTDRDNYNHIINSKRFLSTKDILESAEIDNSNHFLRNKRWEHTIIKVGNINYKIRDQQPISEIVLARSLTHNWSKEDFIFHLNSRVFFWPNLNRLQRHFDRYEDEQPIIFRFNSSDILNLHPEAEFCRLNSGATRCSSHWGGNAPERGPATFVTAANYPLSPSTVAELTVPNFSHLPSTFWTSNSPNGPWMPVELLD